MTISDTPARERMCRPELNEDKSTALNDNLPDIFLIVSDGGGVSGGGGFVQFCTNHHVRAAFRHKTLILALVSSLHCCFDLRFILNLPCTVYIHALHAPIMDNDFNNMFQRILC